MLDGLIEFLKRHQFISAGVLFMLIGDIIAAFRHGIGQVWSWGKSQFFIDIEIPNNDSLYPFIQQWLSTHPKAKKFRLLSASLRVTLEKGAEPEDDGYLHASSNRSYIPPPGKYKRKFFIDFFPAPGGHFLVHNGTFIWINRHRYQAQSTINNEWKEIITLTFFCRDPEKAREILLSAVREVFEQDWSGTRVIPASRHYGEWGLPLLKPMRPLESVILPEGELDRLLEDCRDFIRSEDKYHHLGIPYRRGYLLYGKPGTGKTSTVMAIAGAIGATVWNLNLGQDELGDISMVELMSKVPPGDIILLEDIDCIFKPTRVNDQTGRTLVTDFTFSGLLNAIDGASASEGRLLFATTNHREVIDEALIRPGRCDVQVEYSWATEDQARRLFLRVFPSATPDLVAKFSSPVKEGQYTMADLQGHLLKYWDNPEAAAILDPKT